MKKQYNYIRIYKESAEALRKRLDKINNVDLKNIGIKRARVPQIEFTKFLFNNPIFISNNEIKQMVRKKRNKLC